jgi:hypothetical protein
MRKVALRSVEHLCGGFAMKNGHYRLDVGLPCGIKDAGRARACSCWPCLAFASFNLLVVPSKLRMEDEWQQRPESVRKLSGQVHHLFGVCAVGER